MRAVRWFSHSLLVVAALVQAATAQDHMPWQPSLEAAQQAAAQSNRLVLIHFWSTSCQPCMRLEREVFTKPEVARALERNFVMVKLNVDESPGTARMYGVSSIPTDVITSPNGRLVSQLQSPPSATQYVAQMNQVALGHQNLHRNPAPPAVAAASQPNAAAPTAAHVAGGPAAAPAGTMQPPAAPAVPKGQDRYAEYGQPAANSNPAAAQPPVVNVYGSSAPQVGGAGGANYPPGAPVAQQPAAQQPAVPPQGYNHPSQQSAAQPGFTAEAANYAQQQPVAAQVPQLPPGCPPIGLDGNCPVTLVERHQWAVGDKTYGAIHRGRTYLFLGPAEKEKFLANPDLYSPVLSGHDPVLAIDNQTLVPGRREFGVFYDKRIYLFSNEATLQQFDQQRNRYAAEATRDTVRR